uniref:NADH-ubiquinone oxidoreductase chain 3 n=1 Tax=Chiropterargas boueti TaxID=1827022 RepID=A0A1P8AG60_9ACAR|nr:NADH dehydrogenase subunit 3 [Chiropterargas boueti]AMX74111.1 NADH dehydrogenase subunit 3 [Chiropterargas boueti]
MKYMLLSLTIAFMIFTLALTLTKIHKFNKEKNSPFECGYDPFSITRIPFSLRFFMISILFLMFDIEIVIILPIPLMMLTSFHTTLMILLVLFMIMIGLLYEWKLGMIQWFN